MKAGQRERGGDANTKAELEAGRLFLMIADRRIRGNFAALKSHDDAATNVAADPALAAEELR